MTPLFLYLLKVNIALVLFHLAYRYGLRRLTFYTLNRFYLLFAIGFSSLYPLIDLSGFVEQRQAAGGEIIYYLPDLGSMAAENPLQIWNVLAFVFWSGVAVMGARFLIQLVSLARLHVASRKGGGLDDIYRAAGKERSRQVANREPAIRIIKEKINPFSFFRSIYINPLLHSTEEQQSILKHEQVHVREWHTLDILAGEINRIFYWFNPGAWLMMTAIRENLEFITDRRVLQSGVEAKTYQYSLIKVSEIPYVSSLANNFNFSHLKIRITMMDKKSSSELHLIKYLVLVPFVAAAALIFSVSCSNPLSSQEEHAALSEDTTFGMSPLVIIDGREFGNLNIESLPSENIKSIDILKGEEALKEFGERGINGVVRIATKVKAVEDTLFIDDNAASSARSIFTFSEGKVHSSISVSREPGEKMLVINGDRPFVLVDGKESDYETLQQLFSKDKVQNYTIISGDAARRKEYGEKGKKGVIKITTKGK